MKIVASVLFTILVCSLALGQINQPGGGSGSLPSATAAGYFPVSTGAGTTYTGTLTPSINGAINQTGVTIGSTSYFGEAHGDLSFPDKICGVTAAGAYPPSPATGYGYAAIDVCPALFTAPAPTVVGTTSRSIMGINSALSTQFPDLFNVFAINGQLASPSGSTTNQAAWFGMYHESDWNNTSGTLSLSYAMFGANYNSGSGTCSKCIGGHFEAVGNFYSKAVTPLTTQNTGLECNSGTNSGATHINDYCFRVLTPFTGGTFTNGHIGIQIDDQTNGGALALGSAYAIRIGTGNATPSGTIDFGANPIFVESTGSGFISLGAPTGAIGTVVARWPAVSGYIAEVPCSSVKVFLNSDFTSANASGLQAITGLSCLIATGVGGVALNSTFQCNIMYSQATNVASDQFGVGYTGSVTNFNAWGNVATNTGAATPFTSGTATAIASNTPTAVVTFQPGNTGLNIAQITGTIEPTGGAGTFQLYVTNGTAADVIVVKRDSYCQFF